MPTVLDVQARWGYSEITDSHFSHCYNGPDLPDLREKRKSGVPFEELSPDARYSLAFQCASVRANLMAYFTGITAFDLVQLSRRELGDLIVPPNISNGQWVSYRGYIGNQRDEPDDPPASMPGKEDIAPADPVTVGRAYGHKVLIDGYHRATRFWHRPVGSLTAYMPLF